MTKGLLSGQSLFYKAYKLKRQQRGFTVEDSYRGRPRLILLLDWNGLIELVIEGFPQ